jgi:hypothetical protein
MTTGEGMSSTLITFAQRAADFPYYSLVERTTTFLSATGVNRDNTPRGRGPSRPVATVQRGWVQSGRRGRLRGVQGIGELSASAPSA